MTRAAVTIVCMLLTACTALRVVTHNVSREAQDAPAGRYVLDADHHALTFKVGHLRYAKAVGRFDRSQAVLVFDPEDITRAKLDVVIDASSVSFPTAILTDLVAGPDLLDVAHNPEIRFESRNIRVTGEASGEVDGMLTMNGRRLPVTLIVTFNGGAPEPFTGVYRLGFSAIGELQRSRFGLGAWIPAVADTVMFEIEAEFIHEETSQESASR